MNLKILYYARIAVTGLELSKLQKGEEFQLGKNAFSPYGHDLFKAWRLP